MVTYWLKFAVFLQFFQRQNFVMWYVATTVLSFDEWHKVNCESTFGLIYGRSKNAGSERVAKCSKNLSKIFFTVLLVDSVTPNLKVRSIKFSYSRSIS